MKKIFLLLLLIFSFFLSNDVFGGLCKYDDTTTSSISSFLNDCKPESVVWRNTTDMKIESWFKTKINAWVKNISLILWFLAVGSLVYAGLIMQLSAGEDEKIKKAKNIIKWTLLWFLLLISASGIIYLVINVFFWLAT